MLLIKAIGQSTVFFRHRLLHTKPVLDDGGKPVLDRKGEPKVEPRYGFHAVRHTAASLWFEAGEPIPWVSKMLGHASPYVTMTVYAGVLDKLASERSRERLERMQVVIGGSTQITDNSRAK